MTAYEDLDKLHTMIINGCFGLMIEDWFWDRHRAISNGLPPQRESLAVELLWDAMVMAGYSGAFIKCRMFNQLSREDMYKVINSAKEYARCYE